MKRLTWKHRSLLIYLALYLLFGAVWVWFCVWQLLRLALIPAGSLMIPLLAHGGERVIVSYLERPKGRQRRAHARPARTRKAA